MNLVRPPNHVVPLVVDVSRTPTGVWLEVGGEIDLLNSNQLREQLSAVEFDGAEVIHLDLHRLTFCDSEGTRVLLRFLRRAHLDGHRATIRGATPLLHKVLVLLGDGDLTFE
jgi:anti-sigma B factor antagonist